MLITGQGDLFLHTPTEEELESFVGTLENACIWGVECSIEYITAPRWNGDMWVCLASVNRMLCTVQVNIRETETIVPTTLDKTH